jgi:plastocyanin
MKRLRMLALGIGAIGMMGLVGCGSGNTGPTNAGGVCNGTAAVSGLGTPAVTINATDDLVFVPASSTATVGSVIEFKNTGSVMHTVTFQDNNDGCLTDSSLNPGSTWDVKFTAAGTYNFHCTVHSPNMKGEITVS